MPKIIKFCRHDQPYFEFSNFYPSKVFYRGSNWKTSEHAYQAQKHIHNFEYYDKIFNAKTPMEAAILGRDRKHKIRDDWDDVKDEIMYEVVLSKFSQNKNLKQIIIGTDDAIIVEHRKADKYWGDGGDGSGLNKLGASLMKSREFLKMFAPWVIYPDLPPYSIGWRMGYGEYFMDMFEEWFDNRSEFERNIFKSMFPEPTEWLGFYDDILS